MTQKQWALCGLDQLRLDFKGTSPAKMRNEWGRCGLVCNQSSLSYWDYRETWEVLQQDLDLEIKCFFGPQHGIISTVQDNMIETDHSIHPPTGLPVYSLYSETRTPTAKMLADIDTLVIDLPVTGCRIYTYKYTLAHCMMAAKAHRKKVVVLDRINPLGGHLIDGPLWQKDYDSFVGEYAIPIRHGLSMAEVATFINKDISCQLEIIKAGDWLASKTFLEQKAPLKWMISSPNLPTIDSVFAFFGGVLFEGTNLSEGRGTTLPFQYIGAPYIKDVSQFCQMILGRLKHLAPPKKSSFFLKPTSFQPSFQKWAGQVCEGYLLLIKDYESFPGLDLALATIQAARDLAPKEFSWKKPPYEYNLVDRPMDLILANKKAIEALDQKLCLSHADYRDGLKSFIDKAKTSLLYERSVEVF